MWPNALFIASLHDNAIDYLEQAPVLACSFGVKANTKADRLYIAMRVGGPIQRGERLRNVMASVGLPTPLRKLKGSAITPYASTFIRDTTIIPSSTLAQSIPDRPGEQKRWLRSIRDWRAHIRNRTTWGSPKMGFVWLATNAQHFEEYEAGHILDFIISTKPADWERWSLARMRNEIELWQDRMVAEKDVNKLGAGITLDTEIDLSDWPDFQSVGGYDMVKLATPRMIMEEGRKMRHCVSSYIPDVISGRTHLFSVRQDNRRVATAQITMGRVVQIKAFANKVPPKAAVSAADQFAKDTRP